MSCTNSRKHSLPFPRENAARPSLIQQTMIYTAACLSFMIILSISLGLV